MDLTNNFSLIVSFSEVCSTSYIHSVTQIVMKKTTFVVVATGKMFFLKETLSEL